MDYKQIATDATVFLTPFLSYLVLASNEGVKEIGKKFGEATWDKAKTMWNKITTSSPDTTTIETFATTLARNPDKKTFQNSFAEVLIGQLEVNPQLATDLFNLMKEDDAVQKILIANQSDVKTILQEIEGATGTQDTRVSESKVGKITQRQNRS